LNLIPLLHKTTGFGVLRDSYSCKIPSTFSQYSFEECRRPPQNLITCVEVGANFERHPDVLFVGDSYMPILFLLIIFKENVKAA